MDKTIKSLLPFVIIAAVAFYILLPFQHPWFPQTADGEYYSARLANFYLSLLEGNIPPRWAPTFYSGLGYPVFNFNYPLPNLLGTIFIAFGSTIQAAMKLTIITSYLAGGIGMYFLLKRIFSHPLAPLLGSLLYLTAPYHIHDIFHRATTGELMMFGLLPYVLITFHKSIQKTIHPSLVALMCAAYFLTHNLYTLMFLPLVITFIWVHFGKQAFIINAKSIFFGFLISLFFWIPALGEMKYTVLSTAHINHDYPTELLSLRQTLKLPGLYEPKTNPPTLDSDQPGFAQLFVLVSAIITLTFFARSYKSKKYYLYGWISIIFFFGLLFFINKASIPLWQTFSFIRFMQHPIRLYFIAVFFGAYLGALLVQISKARYAIAGFCTLLTIYNYTFFSYRPVVYVPYDDTHFYRYPLTSAADNEFDPIWYDRLSIQQFEIDHEKEYIVASPSAVITVNHQTLFTKTYSVNNQQPTTIIEKTLYFPGWQTTINGQAIDLSQTASRHHGLINFDLPPGDNLIETKFTQKTPARLIGNSLSVIGLIGALSLGIKKRK